MRNPRFPTTPAKNCRWGPGTGTRGGYGGGKSSLYKSLQPFRLIHGHDRVLDSDPVVLAELPEGPGHSLAGGTGHRGHLFVGEQQREAETPAVEVLADLVAEF